MDAFEERKKAFRGMVSASIDKCLRELETIKDSLNRPDFLDACALEIEKGVTKLEEIEGAFRHKAEEGGGGAKLEY